MTLPTLDQQSWRTLCDQDPEFKMAARALERRVEVYYWYQKLELFLEKGEIVSANYSLRDHRNFGGNRCLEKTSGFWAHSIQ